MHEVLGAHELKIVSKQNRSKYAASVNILVGFFLNDQFSQAANACKRSICLLCTFSVDAFFAKEKHHSKALVAKASRSNIKSFPPLCFAL